MAKSLKFRVAEKIYNALAPSDKRMTKMLNEGRDIKFDPIEMELSQRASEKLYEDAVKKRAMRNAPVLKKK